MRLFQVDAFTKEKFKGNPAGVILDAEGLSDAQMQAIASELNNTESVFVFKSQGSDHDLLVRFFTPKTEINMCGHNTIALHYVRAQIGDCKTGTFRQKTKAGIIPVSITKENGDFQISMAQSLIGIGEELRGEQIDALCSALGIEVKDLDSRCPIHSVSTGSPKLIVGIKKRERLNSIQPHFQELTKIGRMWGTTGFYLFTFDGPNPGCLTSGRMFAPQVGIDEDPVTGVGIGALGFYIAKHKLAEASQTSLKFQALQGEAMGRPGNANVVVEFANGEAQRAHVSGSAVIIFEAKLS